MDKTPPKLDVGMNLALTFAPNEQECLSMGISFPMKIKNVTTAKTQQGNNVKPQFKIRHICYYSWELTQEDVDSISNSLRNCISSGDDFVEPLGRDPKKSSRMGRHIQSPTTKSKWKYVATK